MSRKDTKGRVLRKGESQKKDGSYQYRFTDETGERRCIYSWRLIETDRIPEGKKDSESIREQAKEIQRLLAEGKSFLNKTMTLNQMFDYYIIRKRHNGKPLAETTVINYKSMWDKNMRPTRWGEMKLVDIRKSHVVDFYKDLKDSGKSYGTTLYFKKVLSAVFNMAIDDEIISRNPTIRSMDEVEGSQAVREALTVEQQEGLFAFARQCNPFMYKKMVFLTETMCRISEFAGITWDDVDMEQKVITVDHQLQYRKFKGDEKTEFHIRKTKGSNLRHIPMSDKVYEVMSELKRYYFVYKVDAEIEGKKDFVFSSSTRTLITDTQFSNE